MHTWTTIVSLPLCAALTAAGLVLSWFTWRRRGARRGIRGAAWSLLPLALYLTGAVPMLWRVGSAIATFAQGFVFSPKTWAGLVLFGLSLVIFLVSGGIPMLTSGRKQAGQKEGKQADTTATGGGVAVPADRSGRAPAEASTTATRPATSAKRGKDAAGGGDGLDTDVAEILRRRGIR